MLSHIDGLLDEVVEVLWELRAESVFLEHSEDLGASDSGYLGDAVVVSENGPNLGGGGSLLGQLDNLLNQVIGGDLNPAGGSFSER